MEKPQYVLEAEDLMRRAQILYDSAFQDHQAAIARTRDTANALSEANELLNKTVTAASESIDKWFAEKETS